MSHRIRHALLAVVLLACVTVRTAGALAAVQRPVHAAHAVHHVVHTAQHVSRATRLAREQAKIVRFARRLIGVPYRYGGTSPTTGFDCSGFTRFVYAHFGISLPHYSGAQFDMGRRVSRGGLRPGDLLFFDAVGHVGIYIGAGRFIHAPHTGTRVQITALSGWYSARYDGARRIV
jgi:cell wall-associated NlpC family hydrolase